ncbi:MAG: MFS transporter [Ignavibacteriales bacterium]|nr:MFS transporter [Ignavibacteriales bacterium]
MRKEKLIIIFTVLVDVIGFGMVIPILPFYVTEFGASPFVITALFASFSLCSFFSAPLLGALSDRIGRRPVLIVSLFTTAIGWFVFASATSIPLLFLGRVIDGLAAGNFTIAQGYLVDISEDDKERTANLGIIGATFGVGFMLGPLLGGVLSKVSHAFPFWIAGGMALANTVTAYYFLPETHNKREARTPLNFNPLAPLARALLDSKLRPVYFSWMLFMLAFVTSQSIFALFVNDVFGFDSFVTGMLFTGVGVIVALNQTLLLKKFWLRFFRESTLQPIMFAALTLGALLVTLKSLQLFYLSLVLFGTGQSILRVVITSEVAGSADPQKKGETLGILSSILSACMVAGPIASGALFEFHNTLPYFAAALYLLIGLTVALRSREQTSELRIMTDRVSGVDKP